MYFTLLNFNVIYILSILLVVLVVVNTVNRINITHVYAFFVTEHNVFSNSVFLVPF